MMQRTLIIGLPIFWFCFVLGYVEGLAFYTEKPSYIESCRIQEPDFTNCSTRSIQGFLNEVIKGIPEIEESFGPIDPMKQDQLTFTQADRDVAIISTNLTNLEIRGFGKMVVKESRVNKTDFSWMDRIYIPRMRMDGNYKMIGHILLVPLRGSGRMFMELDDLEIQMTAKTRLYEKGGYTFYNVTEAKAKLEISRLKVNFENLFNGSNKQLESDTNQFFNDHWQEFFEAMRPLIVETVERTLLDLLKKMFNVMPANFFVEDIPTSLLLYGRKTRLIE
ncbi:uncharacterized protein LOC132786509 [Drosophila nasuta]|uniref:uncharacterized protein LOC132786509 n=1 Tax=Drosophila nasuta TaxID=42062 RepID=UPI00295E8B52|nr:uncharacterized protein LOC132786509 [Drosophila nasuta]